MKIFKSLTVLAVFLFTMPAHAYVDPGTGSMVLQVIIGGLLAAVFMVKTYYYELKRRINKLLGRDSGTKKDIDAGTTDMASSEKPSND
jgi:hypothetical protein